MKTSFRSYLSEGINDAGLFKAIFMAGTPGAGKSYTISKIQSGRIAPRVVNTDIIIEFLANKKNRSLKGSDNLNAFWKEHEDKSKKLNRDRLLSYLNGMLPLIIDGTSSDINNLLARAGALESLGYDVGMVFVNTQFETAMKRICQRDRSVDKEVVEQFYAIADENRKFYKSKFDFFLEIDNNTGQLTDDVVLASYKKTSSFFDGDIKNPIGRRVLEKLKDEKQKELMPIIVSKDELNRKLDTWYRD